MENLNLHKSKLFALILAGVALISLLLPWSAAKGGMGMVTARGQNGFHSWGLLVLIGIVGVIAASLMGDKTKNYEGQTKQIAMGSFGLMALGAVMFLVRLLTGSQSYGGFKVKFSDIAKPGMGLFLGLIVST